MHACRMGEHHMTLPSRPPQGLIFYTRLGYRKVRSMALAAPQDIHRAVKGVVLLSSSSRRTDRGPIRALKYFIRVR